MSALYEAKASSILYKLKVFVLGKDEIRNNTFKSEILETWFLITSG